MSNDFKIEKLSDRLTSLLPEYIQHEAPVFELFLKSYFEYLESEIVTLSSESELDGILMEDSLGSILVEPQTVKPSSDAETSKLIYESTGANPNATAEPWKVGEYVVGSVSKSVAKVNSINGLQIYVSSIHGTGFSEGETLTGRESKQTGVVSGYKENTIAANNKILDYSDIDRTSEDFLQHFQTDFSPSLDLKQTQNKRLTIKGISDLYKEKGTAESLKFLMRILYNEDAEIRYPDNETIYASESDYSQKRRVNILMSDLRVAPSATDKITQYTASNRIQAESIIENVFPIDAETGEYSLEITDNHKGTFLKDQQVTLVDRDGVTTTTGTLKGIVSDITNTSSSTYIQHDDNGDILFESGLPAVYVGTYDGTQSNTESSHDGGILLEQSSVGSMYSLNDAIEFTGAKSNTNATISKAVVNGLLEGQVDEIFIEDGGTGYKGGDLVVFESSNRGSGAEAVLGSVGDEIILEGATVWGQYEITATAGQALFTGADNNGNQIIFNDESVEVYVDGIEKISVTDYTHKNDRVVFTTPLNGGELVEIYTKKMRLLSEDGEPVQMETTNSNIRSVFIKSGGIGYTEVPKVFPGGYLYFTDTTGYVEGEVVTGTNSGATGTILKNDSKNKRLIIKRLSTDTGAFVTGEEITGGTSTTVKLNTQSTVSSGTGARLYAYSDTIGGVGSINIQEQGHEFTEDSVLSGTSHFPMLITTPSANLTKDLVITGRVSGTTGKVVSYDADRHILTYTSLDGLFLSNEMVDFNSVDTFKILKSNPYQARGLVSGEGVIQEQLLGDRSTLDASASNIQDSLYYQTHSYVIKVGESINKYRSVVKDLLHPAGHVFFGEVAIKQTVDTTVEKQIKFRPTIVINEAPVLTNPQAFANSMRQILLWTTDEEMNEPLVVLKDAGVPTVSTDPRTGLAITEPFTEYGDSSHRNRHLNIFRIKSFVATSSYKTRRQEQRSGVETFIVNVVNNGSQNVYEINGEQNATLTLKRGHTYHFVYPQSHPFRFSTTADGTHGGGSEYRLGVRDIGLTLEIKIGDTHEDTFYYYCGNHSGMGGTANKDSSDTMPTVISIDTADNGYLVTSNERRPSDKGKVVSVGSQQDEVFLLENGNRFLYEEEVYHFGLEPSIVEQAAGQIIGDKLIMENNDLIIMEDATFDDVQDNYISTERTSIISHAPLGSSLRSLNTITGQQVYNISYYLKDETDNDDLILENGTGNIMTEESKPEGLRISDLETYFPQHTVNYYSDVPNLRSNIAFSSYIKSA